MVRLGKLTDYGLVLMTCIARSHAASLRTARGLAQESRLPLSTVSKLLKELLQSGLLVSHRGIKGGYIHGASDRIGAHPSRNPVGPGDVVATIYHCLGISHDREIVDRLGRPFTLVPAGGVIRELLA